MRKKASFTIVELLIYMGLFSILLIVLTDIFVSSLELKIESETYSSVQQDGRFILAKFIYDINQAKSIIDPPNLGDTTNSLQLNISGTNTTYNLNNGNLEIINDKGNNILNGFDTNVDSISFQRIGNVTGKNTIVVNFTLSSKATKKSGREIKNFKTTVAIR